MDPPPGHEAGLDPLLVCVADLDLPLGHVANLEPSLGCAISLDWPPNQAAVRMLAPTGGAQLGGGGTPLWEGGRRRALSGGAPLGGLPPGGALRGGEARRGEVRVVVPLGLEDGGRRRVRKRLRERVHVLEGGD